MHSSVKSDVKIRTSPFHDWRDWFLNEDDKINEVYKTKMSLYIDEHFLITETMIPINFENINFKIQLKPDKLMTISTLYAEIPEMNIYREKKFNNILVGPSNTVNFEYNFAIGGEDASE